MPPNTNLSGWVANRNYAICVEGCKKIPVRSVDLCSSCCPFPWSFEVDPDVQLYAGEISNPVVCWPKFQEQATKKHLQSLALQPLMIPGMHIQPSPRVFTAPTAARPSPSYLPATVHRQCSWDPEWHVMPPCVIVKETRRGTSWNHSVVGNLDDYWGKQCLAISFLKNTGMLT